MSKKLILIAAVMFLLFPINAAGNISIGLSGIDQSKAAAITPLTIIDFLEKFVEQKMSATSKALEVKAEKQAAENKAIKEKLAGQLNMGESRIELPNPLGHNTYTISVEGGAAKLCHYSYNPDGHTWSSSPRNGQAKYINITDDRTYSFEINIDETYGQRDKVFLVNPGLWGSIDVDYKVSKD